MDHSAKSTAFEVYLRLRPAAPLNNYSSSLTAPDRFLTVEDPPTEDAPPTHITLNPPNDNRRRAVEKFAFTKVFEEEASQLDIFGGTGILPLVEGVLGPQGGDGRDGLLATLGVTGSGKTHTILGSKSQRGLTQLALDVLFRSISNNILDPNTTTSLHATIAASDPSEAQVMSAQMFLDSMFGDTNPPSRAGSRAPTPMVVRIPPSTPTHPRSQGLYPSLNAGSPPSTRIAADSVLGTAASPTVSHSPFSSIPSYMQSTIAKARKYVFTKSPLKGESYPPPTARRQLLQRPSVLPQLPDISNVTVNADQHAEYAILISMYEVYNDRIFDLLTPALPGKSTKDSRRRPLLFKPTEQSPDRKVVAGLRKIICGTMREALMVLEAGLHERRVAGTGSNSVSSRSHGFFCVEVKKRSRSRAPGSWGGSALTIVDLAGSERARDAKTQGATLQEAGKINESLMYLGQCLQMQSDIGSSTKPNLVPFRQCKLTELLFSNSFPSTSTPSHHHSSHNRNPQKAIMIVTADPLGDFNATSQILRYSALAREITVPRIPSVTSTILAQSTASHYFAPRSTGRSSPTETERETMEIAALEIARLSEEIDGFRDALRDEQDRRVESDAHLETMTDRIMEVEMTVREEVFAEMEAKMQEEMRRWKASFAAEAERNEEHLDRKLEILTKTMDLGADEEEKENANSGPGDDLELENDRLRREVDQLRRELASRSPSKSQRMPLRESKSNRTLNDIGRSMENLRISNAPTPQQDRPRGGALNGSGSPLKKVRKFTGKKWDMGAEDERELL
ncbi:Kinesin-like motor protein [Lachnellula occidentalis]|uniref:Kinesin-like motor protein n=1 Tax=Lachnellula occidentalis TaxID=215460 RepID=A0A8H8RKZ1_9HELO|nr:Kinesin-like motor protein [Lachnellula occidentalis]